VPPPERAPFEDFLVEAERQVSICNGCRYCEGYCAVFPAIERMPSLSAGDLTYLANLCHDCRACFQACMYAPPHDFGVDLPLLLSEARERSYEEYARPRWLSRVFGRGLGSIGALSLAGAVAFTLLAWSAGQTAAIFRPETAPASFYDVVPYGLMLAPMMLISLFAIALLTSGYVVFQRASHRATPIDSCGRLKAIREIATLRWLRGGGGDCYYPDAERPSRVRRTLHHATAYGFLLALVSTTLAAFYKNVLGASSPYPLMHPVVVLGIAGGVAMVFGTTGLLWLKRGATPLDSPSEKRLNTSFLVSLELASVTGLLLLFLRETRAMGPLLIVHLGTVVALYLTAPYGKFVHIVYRSAAVIRSVAERAADTAHNGRTEDQTLVKEARTAPRTSDD
jgi:citrate/tricarballylate utilization protein